MKKAVVLTLELFTLAGVLTGCAPKAAVAVPATEAPIQAVTEAPTEVKAEPVTIKIGADLVPHSEILNFIKPKLEAQGVILDIINFDDAGQLNPALQEKQLDANYFQHVPYLDSVAKEKGYDFAVLANVHVEPIGLYSEKLKSFSDLKDGAKIAIPNNPSNEFRALVLLQNNGLIKLKEGIVDYAATPADIIENPKNIEFVEIDSAQLARALPDVDAAVINTNLILEAGIDPTSALIREDAKSPYGNIVVVRTGDENRPELIKLKEALLSEDVKKFITEKYGVAVVPAF